jgi:hypothetical protein
VKTAPIPQVYTVRKCRKKPIKTDIHNQETAEYPGKKFSEYWENCV